MIATDIYSEDASGIASAVNSGRLSAHDTIMRTIEGIRRSDSAIGAFTRILDARALADADRVDRLIAAGGYAGALAGVPFAVKDLFDVAGLVTTAGTASRENAEPASADAASIARLAAAGAILVGTLNMDEFAYGFSTENAHYGTTRNPYGSDHIAGGSSGGSAAAVAARMVPLALGSDTNGSIRVPSSLCGVYGLRPSMSTVPMDGIFSFVESLDVAGPLAHSLDTLAAAFETLADERLAPSQSVRVARLDGWFRRNGDPAAIDAIDAAAAIIGDAPLVHFPLAEAARSAAFLITASEGGARHFEALRRDPMALDPATRDRLLAGLLCPREALDKARSVRDMVLTQATRLFEDFDVLIAPATPCAAPPIGGAMIEIDGRLVSARANLGLYTQPLSLAGLPVLTVPIRRPGQLPLGFQLVGAPGGEAALFALARLLENSGITGTSLPNPPC